MAQLNEILQQEKQRTTGEPLRQIHLYPEGGFYRAYEWSVWLCLRYVRQLKPTKRMVKSVNAPMVFVGFPQTSLSKCTVEGAEMGGGPQRQEPCPACHHLTKEDALNAPPMIVRIHMLMFGHTVTLCWMGIAKPHYLASSSPLCTIVDTRKSCGVVNVHFF